MHACTHAYVCTRTHTRTRIHAIRQSCNHIHMANYSDIVRHLEFVDFLHFAGDFPWSRKVRYQVLCNCSHVLKPECRHKHGRNQIMMWYHLVCSKWLPNNRVACKTHTGYLVAWTPFSWYKWHYTTAIGILHPCVFVEVRDILLPIANLSVYMHAQAWMCIHVYMHTHTCPCTFASTLSSLSALPKFWDTCTQANGLTWVLKSHEFLHDSQSRVGARKVLPRLLGLMRSQDRARRLRL